MRRGLFVVLMAGLLLVPAQVSAATPQAAISVDNVHWVERGVIGADVTWRCTAPTTAGAQWDPVLVVVIGQGARGNRYGYVQVALDRSTCDGASHQRSVTVTPDGRRFHGTRFVVWGLLDASWYVERTDTFVDQWAETEPTLIRLRRR